ncbi:MAG TPA: lipoyl(octanoyl) transferase LipB [Mycobacteriales bacterium]|nr:lipoyl(octanoyl) transferase LipB [Mycobacteriales bacterium]
MRIRKLGRVPYEQAWALQRELHAQIVAGQEPDTILLLEHDSVYTAGRRTAADERPIDPTLPIVEVDRGGKLTWHGPGQLVGYPLVRLPDPVDVVAYVRRLESMLMAVCRAAGLPTCRVEGRSGVWTSDGRRKVAAIGVRVAQGVTMHGFALNADPDLGAYDAIIACGIRDAGVTSLTRELGRPVTVPALLPLVESQLPALLGVPA